MHNMKSIWKISFKVFLVAFFSFSFTCYVNAKSINSSYNYVDTTTMNYVQNIYERESYRYGLLVSESIRNDYNYISYYYLCLTNDKVDVSNAKSFNSSCSKIYQFYRQNNTYYINEMNDKELSASDSIYYHLNGKTNIIPICLLIISILMCVSLLYIFIKDLF